MMIAADAPKLTAPSTEEQRKLASACLMNRWLVSGIAPEKRNASPEQYFSFLESDSLDDLLEYFRSGLHGIREGIVHRGLAFVQQVDLGDEWLVLRREFDPDSGEAIWVPFESYSFERVIRSRARFECAITALLDMDRYDIAALISTSARRRRDRSTS